MHHTLVRGTILGAFGIILILLGGIFLPPRLLQYLGLPILMLGGALILWGMLPYKKLRRLEIKPYELIAFENKQLQYLAAGKPLLTIPSASIERISYFESGNDYGITIALKKPIPEKIRIQDSHFHFEEFQEKSRSRYCSDLFLPYFSERSCNLLNNFMNEAQ